MRAARALQLAIRASSAGGTVVITFAEFLADYGLCVDEPIRDGELHRVPTDDDKPGKKSGAYACHGDTGVCFNWKSGGDPEHWRSDSLNGLPENLREREIEAQRRRLHQSDKHKKTALKAERMWSEAALSDGSHGYLQSKQVKVHGLRRSGGLLLLPLRDAQGNITTLQQISGDGSKRFMAGGRTKDCWHLIGELEDASRVLICEGWATGATLHEATGTPVACAMNCNNLHGAAAHFADDFEVLICADDDSHTETTQGKNPGWDKAEDAAKEFKVRICVPIFPNRDDGTDFNDLHVLAGPNEVSRQVEQAWCDEPRGYQLDEIALRLSKMPIEKRNSERQKWQDYFGINKQELTQAIRRHERDEDVDGEEKLKPWPEPISTATLLDELAGQFSRFLILPEHGACLLALWTVHAYCYNQFPYTPILNVYSPTKQCAKSRVLEVLSMLTLNPKLTSNMTGAAMFRTIDSRPPTLLMDEMDRCSKEKREMVTVVLNAGFHKDGKVDRCDGDDNQVREFAVFCPKALAGIGEFATDTVRDRSIRICMQKKLKTETVEKFRRYDPIDLRRKCLRWSSDHQTTLADARPKMPDTLSDRQEDIWEPLFAIAGVAGSEWTDNCWRAASAQADATTPDVTDDLTLLAAVRNFFENTSVSKASSAVLCDWLNEQDDLPYKDFRHSKGIDARRLSRSLKPFQISPRSVNLGGPERPKGYHREVFDKAFNRYLPPLETASQPLPATSPNIVSSSGDAEPLPETLPETLPLLNVADKGATVSNENNGSSGVAVTPTLTHVVKSQPSYVEEF